MELTILHINDHHSNLDSKKKDFKLKNAAGATVTVNADAGGFARVTGAIKALSAASPNVLKLHAGDATTGTLYFNRAGDPGEADAAMMNTVCFDAMTLGNHEFDKGDSGLKRFIDLLHKGACQTPVLSANVTFGANSALNPSRAPGLVKPSIVLQRDGQSIGLVGLTIANKTQQSSSPDPGTVFGDETAAAQQQIDALRAQGVNKIIVMSHIGYDYDKQIIPNLSGVDVVVGGDSHTLLGPAGMAGYGVGSPAGAYPTEVKNKDGKRVCLVQAWEYSQVVGELKVSFDANGDVTACAGTPHVLMGSAYKIGGAAVSPADQAAIAADIKASGFLYPQEPDAGALAVLQPSRPRSTRSAPARWRRCRRNCARAACRAGPARATTAGPAWTATRWAASACAAATSSSWLPRPIWKWATPATAAPTSRCKAAAACACRSRAPSRRPM